MMAPFDATGAVPTMESSMTPAGGAWILDCDIPSPGTPPAVGHRFRIGQRLLQQWRPETREFGPNLCLEFSCSADRGQLKGVIQSATLILTIVVDPSRRTARWSTQGASGLKATAGSCTVAPQVKAGGAAP